MTFRRFAWLAGMLLCSCGGEQAVDVPPSASDFGAPPADAVPYDPDIGALAVVSGGRARVGGWEFDTAPFFFWRRDGGAPPSSLGLSPLGCSISDASSDGNWTYNAEVIVAPFQMMTTEVTNRAYAICVDAGACPPPDIQLYNASQPIDWRDTTIANHPVVLNWSIARSFCRHYGGDLPTAGEYARATSGDAETYAQPSILSLIVACATGQSSDTAECSKLAFAASLADVASDPNDVGPFGHYDLYANAVEWVRGYFDHQSAPGCAHPIDEHDIPLTFPGVSDGGGGPGFNTFTYFPVSLGLPNTQDLQPVLSVSPDIPTTAPWVPQSSNDSTRLGFRCAFPTSD